MENRNYFSLHCVQMETQLIHANLEGLFHALQHMVIEEARAHTEVSTKIKYFLSVFQARKFDVKV